MVSSNKDGTKLQHFLILQITVCKKPYFSLFMSILTPKATFFTLYCVNFYTFHKDAEVRVMVFRRIRSACTKDGLSSAYPRLYCTGIARELYGNCTGIVRGGFEKHKRMRVRSKCSSDRSVITIHKRAIIKVIAHLW